MSRSRNLRPAPAPKLETLGKLSAKSNSVTRRAPKSKLGGLATLLLLSLSTSCDRDDHLLGSKRPPAKDQPDARVPGPSRGMAQAQLEPQHSRDAAVSQAADAGEDLPSTGSSPAAGVNSAQSVGEGSLEMPSSGPHPRPTSSAVQLPPTPGMVVNPTPSATGGVRPVAPTLSPSTSAPPMNGGVSATLPKECAPADTSATDMTCKSAYQCGDAAVTTYCSNTGAAWSCYASETPSEPVNAPSSALTSNEANFDWTNLPQSSDPCGVTAAAYFSAPSWPKPDQADCDVVRAEGDASCTLQPRCQYSVELPDGTATVSMPSGTGGTCSANAGGSDSCKCFLADNTQLEIWTVGVSNDHCKEVETVCRPEQPLAFEGPDACTLEAADTGNLPDGTLDYCSELEVCGPSESTGDVQALLRRELFGDSCSRDVNGDWQCDCHAGGTLTFAGSVAQPCDTILDYCEGKPVLTAGADVPSSCTTGSQSSDGIGCQGTNECSQEAQLGDLALQLTMTSYLDCSPDESGAWLCTCSPEAPGKIAPATFAAGRPSSSNAFDVCTAAQSQCSQYASQALQDVIAN